MTSATRRNVPLVMMLCKILFQILVCQPTSFQGIFYTCTNLHYINSYIYQK